MEDYTVDIEDLVNDLAITRKQLEDAKADLELLKKNFEKKNEPLITTVNLKTLACDTLEKAIKGIALDIYDADPSSKSICPGVGIRVYTKYEYDENKALEWAKENARFIIVTAVDKKLFEKICAGAPPDFVTVKPSPSATIATALEIKPEEVQDGNTTASPFDTESVSTD